MTTFNQSGDLINPIDGIGWNVEVFVVIWDAVRLPLAELSPRLPTRADDLKTHDCDVCWDAAQFNSRLCCSTLTISHIFSEIRPGTSLQNAGTPLPHEHAVTMLQLTCSQINAGQMHLHIVVNMLKFSSRSNLDLRQSTHSGPFEEHVPCGCR